MNIGVVLAFSALVTAACSAVSDSPTPGADTGSEARAVDEEKEHTARPIDAPRTKTVRPKDTRVVPYEIVPGLDPDSILEGRKAPATWVPRSGSLDDTLPQPWPDHYLNLYKQHFNSWAYKVNAAMICAYVRDNPDARKAVEMMADELFSRMLHYTRAKADARFVIYEFKYEYKGREVEAPWTSAYGNGAVIMGTLALHACWPKDEYIDVAYELANAYRVMPNDDLWFSFVTDEALLWFEEMPLSEPTMILNGHITAIIGLYYLWDRVDRDESVLELLRAGITSVREYIPRYRRIGQINCYDLLPPCHDDYGPERTVRQQNVLYELTGDDLFREMRDQFGSDMGVDPRKFELD
jgi:hypothetical protein